MEAETAAFGYPSRARISRPAPSSAERRAAVSQTATQPVAKCSNGSILEPERFAPVEVTTSLENRFRVQRFPLKGLKLVQKLDQVLETATTNEIRRHSYPIWVHGDAP
jgi:hypothetical protein